MCVSEIHLDVVGDSQHPGKYYDRGIFRYRIILDLKAIECIW